MKVRIIDNCGYKTSFRDSDIYETENYSNDLMNKIGVVLVRDDFNELIPLHYSCVEVI